MMTSKKREEMKATWAEKSPEAIKQGKAMLKVVDKFLEFEEKDIADISTDEVADVMTKAVLTGYLHTRRAEMKEQIALIEEVIQSRGE